jgi:hypothetical protein
MDAKKSISSSELARLDSDGSTETGSAPKTEESSDGARLRPDSWHVVRVLDVASDECKIVQRRKPKRGDQEEHKNQS